jgi:hypothetical protein
LKLSAWTVVLGVLGPLTGALIAIYGETIKNRLLGPKLHLDFEPGDGLCIVDLPDAPNSPQCRWARISVINCGRTFLRQCQGFITNIEQEQGITWVKTNPQLVDPLVLEWAALNDDVKFKARDIPRKIQFFINVLASADNHAENDDSLGLSVEHLPQRPKVNTPFAPRHRYRFTVTVIGDQIEPKIIQLVVNWNGNWKFDSAKWV